MTSGRRLRCARQMQLTCDGTHVLSERSSLPNFAIVGTAQLRDIAIVTGDHRAGFGEGQGSAGAEPPDLEEAVEERRRVV
jgi:hypothetical protein